MKRGKILAFIRRDNEFAQTETEAMMGQRYAFHLEIDGYKGVYRVSHIATGIALPIGGVSRAQATKLVKAFDDSGIDFCWSEVEVKPGDCIFLHPDEIYHDLGQVYKKTMEAR